MEQMKKGSWVKSTKDEDGRSGFSFLFSAPNPGDQF